MSRRPRRNHSLAFKVKVSLAAIKGEKTLAELAEQFDVHANQITSWRTQLLEGATEVFGGDSKADAPPPIDVKELHAKIGELSTPEQKPATWRSKSRPLDGVWDGWL